MFKSLYLNSLEKRATRLQPRQMEESAVVFSPHYDDETLGAGGTILQKRRSGAEVHLVFMTDGSKSHAQAIDGARLSAMRRDEALQAASALGVDESHVHFLNYPETKLRQHSVEAVQRAAALLAEFCCKQVYVPSTLEPLIWSEDHAATTDVVFRALRRTGARPRILGYLVWFWYHWPWVPILRSADARRLAQLSWRGRFGLSAVSQIDTGNCITDVRAEKRNALDKHASQMVRLVHDKPWPVLGDVGSGEFLKQFFGSHEFFTSHSPPEAQNAPNQ